MQGKLPDRSEMLQLVLSSTEQEPPKLHWTYSVRRVGSDHRGYRPLPRIVSRGFESLEELKASFGEATHNRLGRFIRCRGIPGRVSLLELESRWP
jgi:hypothetical protein